MKVEKRCYMCGVVGLTKSIVTCMKCKTIFIHTYCMKTVQVIIPNDWLCEDCCEAPKLAASKFTGEIHVPKRPAKVIPTNEAIALASQSSLSKGKRHLASPEKACKTVEIPKKRVESLTSMFPPATVPTRCDLCVCVQEKSSAGLPSAEQSRCKKHSMHGHIPSEVPEPFLKQKSCIKNPVHAHTPSPSSRPSPKLQCFKELFIPEHTTSRKSRNGIATQGGDPCKGTLKANRNAREQRLSDGQPILDRCLPNHPALHPTWKGSFRTSNFAAPVTSCDFVWGYPPAKVGRKAYEFSKTMPDVLHLEVISRCTVWPNMFNDGGPDKNDIGLYFLPIGDRSEQRYSCLVQHLEKKDVVLKSCIRETELLIFTSTYLDEESKKINEAYYLWGLFVPPVITSMEPQQNQSSSKTNTEPAIQHILEKEREPVENPRASRFKMSKEAVAACQPVSKVQVKLEKWDEDDLASPPGFVALVEPKVPPGFEETSRRVKYKTIADILHSANC